MKFKIVEQKNYKKYGDSIELMLDKPLPIGWFGKTITIDGKEIYFTRSIPAECIDVLEDGDYVGKIFEIDDKNIKKPYRE